MFFNFHIIDIIGKGSDFAFQHDIMAMPSLMNIAITNGLILSSGLCWVLLEWSLLTIFIAIFRLAITQMFP